MVISKSRHSFNDACKLKGACVYVFIDGDSPVYVGKTGEIKKRFEPYKARKCHNYMLNNWLTRKNLDFSVDIYRSSNIDRLEKHLIELNKSQLFNLSSGNENDWFSQARINKPWVAGRGILSPISCCLQKMKCDPRKEKIKQWLKTLSDSDRCLAEVQTAALLPLRHKRWLSITSGKMIECMELPNG